MVVYLFVVIQIYNKFSGFLLFFTIIYNLSLEMSDEPEILAWLSSHGYLEEIVKEDGGKTKRPTEAGRAIGISTEMRDGSNGRFLFVVYNANAQRFILDNIYSIIEG